MAFSPIRVPIPCGPRSVKCFSALGTMASQLRMPPYLHGHSGSGQRHGQYRACNLDPMSHPYPGTNGREITHQDRRATSTSSPMCRYIVLRKLLLRSKMCRLHDVPFTPRANFVNVPTISLGTSYTPEVPLGNTAVSIAICPCSTRVKARRCPSVGVPKCKVRVTSVVPSKYCPEIPL